jgi:hypothetical protein
MHVLGEVAGDPNYHHAVLAWWYHSGAELCCVASTKHYKRTGLAVIKTSY